MGIFDFFKGPDINAGAEQYRNTAGAVLLDVRTAEEYRTGRIPGGKNLPLSDIRNAGTVVPDRNTPVFVYCLSGGRSMQAAAVLKSMGYTNVTNIGGINSYKGKKER